MQDNICTACAMGTTNKSFNILKHAICTKRQLNMFFYFYLQVVDETEIARKNAHSEWASEIRVF